LPLTIQHRLPHDVPSPTSGNAVAICSTSSHVTIAPRYLSA
jgi:hypothetical protein